MLYKRFHFTGIKMVSQYYFTCIQHLICDINIFSAVLNEHTMPHSLHMYKHFLIKVSQLVYISRPFIIFCLSINVGLLSTNFCTYIWYNHVLSLTCVIHPLIALWRIYRKGMNSVIFTIFDIISPHAKIYTNVIMGQIF